jgi:hypothetical protein|tara:strand:- start:149 stop:946 length:798 start_codon:yes stop_codon:yes gene_type:complete
MALATDVGGVSATANPVANSSGSVTNQAIQVLQGPYITNTYGDGISCQGPTLNITPFLADSKSWQIPKEEYYDQPVYDMTTDDDGNLKNPGDIVYYVPTRTGQKDTFNFNWGISATIAVPLDEQLQDQCKQSANSQISYRNQLVANKRLDFELARLKNCGDLMKEGIQFHPKSQYAAICADVMLTPIPGKVTPHIHSISALPDEAPSLPDSEISEQESAPSEKVPSAPSQGFFGFFRSLFSRQASQPLEEDQPEVLLGGPMSLPQ